jgi:hypothetical protein
VRAGQVASEQRTCWADETSTAVASSAKRMIDGMMGVKGDGRFDMSGYDLVEKKSRKSRFFVVSPNLPVWKQTWEPTR